MNSAHVCVNHGSQSSLTLFEISTLAKLIGPVEAFRLSGVNRGWSSDLNSAALTSATQLNLSHPKKMHYCENKSQSESRVRGKIIILAQKGELWT